MRLIDADALMTYCNNLKDKKIDANDIARFPTAKEQEPKQVDLWGKDDWYAMVCVCPDCNAEWMSKKSETHFCPSCGRKVKWE